jgi:hypothetical protein
MVKHQIQYSGVVRGRMIIGTVSRSSDDDTVDLLSQLNSKIKVLMIVLEGEKEISVLEDPHGVWLKFYSFKRPPEMLLT